MGISVLFTDLHEVMVLMGSTHVFLRQFLSCISQCHIGELYTWYCRRSGSGGLHAEAVVLRLECESALPGEPTHSCCFSGSGAGFKNWYYFISTENKITSYTDDVGPGIIL